MGASENLTLSAIVPRLYVSEPPYLDCFTLRADIHPPGNGDLALGFALGGEDGFVMVIDMENGHGEEMIGYEDGMKPGVWTCEMADFDGAEIALSKPFSFEVCNHGRN
jgi:hypothetical protein